MSTNPSETKPHKKDEFTFYTYAKLTELICGLQQGYHRAAQFFSPVEFSVLFNKVKELRGQYDAAKKDTPNPTRQGQATAIVTFAQRLQEVQNVSDREKTNERNAILGFLLFRLMRLHRNVNAPEAKKSTSTFVGSFFRSAAQLVTGAGVESELEKRIQDILKSSNIKAPVQEKIAFEYMDDYAKWLYLESFQRVLKEEEKNNSSMVYFSDSEEKTVLSTLIKDFSNKESVIQERRCIHAINFLQTLSQEFISPFQRLFEEADVVSETNCNSLLAGDYSKNMSKLKSYHLDRCMVLFKAFPGGEFREIKLWEWFSKLSADKKDGLLVFMRKAHQERCVSSSLGLMLTLFYDLEDALPTRAYLLDESGQKNLKFVAAMKELFCPQGRYCLEPENALHLRGALDTLEKYMQARKKDNLPIDEALFKGSYEAVFETIQKVRNAIDKLSIAPEPHRASREADSPSYVM